MSVFLAHQFAAFIDLISSIPPLTLQQIGMLIAGILIGIQGVVFGGSMFVSLPLFVYLVPGCTTGQYVGNLKLGSLLRSIASTTSTRNSVDWAYCLGMAWPFVLGTIMGAYLISTLIASYLLLLMVVAVLVAEFAERISKLEFWHDRDFFFIAAFAAGIYAGFLGVGLAYLLVALIRVNNPKDEDIIWVKIQARFIETITVIAAVCTHFVNGNIKIEIVFYWAIGTTLGGILGGRLLKRLVAIPPKAQLWIMRASYAMGIVGMVYLFAAPQNNLSTILSGK